MNESIATQSSNRCIGLGIVHHAGRRFAAGNGSPNLKLFEDVLLEEVSVLTGVFIKAMSRDLTVLHLDMKPPKYWRLPSCIVG